jgi:16S rRNA (cytosine1402-N4)-methyltransferase
LNTVSVSGFHVPVLAEKTVDFLVTDPDAVYLDLTVGGGGHSALIYRQLSEQGKLLGCDQDRDAIRKARAALPPAVLLFQCRFSEAETVLQPHVKEGATGALMDLGVSSFQIDTPERGFSHRFSGPLDLRMDQTRREPAAALLKRTTTDELTRLIRIYGEDPQARRIARAIERAQQQREITTTEELAYIISQAVPATRIKSLARVFQALRIAVNDEMSELEAGLTGAWNLLRIGGRLVVITYHSLEDRIVKTFMKTKAAPPRDPSNPWDSGQPPHGRLLLRKPIVPDDDEISRNPRARSAKLRAIEKLI